MSDIDDCVSQLAELWPALAKALARDAAGADAMGTRSWTAATVVNADVLAAMITLDRDVPAAVRTACEAISEPWQHRDLGECLRQVPRLASRMRDLGLRDQWLAEQARAWLRITKRALGLRKPDVLIGYPCPWSDSQPEFHAAPAMLIMAGDEGFLRPGPDDMRVEWVSLAQIYCPACAASWAPSQWPLLGRMLAAPMERAS